MIDIDMIARTYFYFDEPVDYEIESGKIKIYPIMLYDSEIFLSSLDILNVDKNNSSSVEIIQMPYLKFICKVLFQEKNSIQKLLNILVLCLKLKRPEIRWEEDKPYIYDSVLDIKINCKQFDDIKRIILYQNIINYDDDYINPELKQAMGEMDSLKNKGVIIPTLERKMAIISSHTGISKKEQKEMTFRSHCLLFHEVREEIKYTVSMPVALYCGSGDKIEDWFFKKEKGKFDEYITNVDSYTQSMGGKSLIKSSVAEIGDEYENAYSNFNN